MLKVPLYMILWEIINKTFNYEKNYYTTFQFLILSQLLMFGQIPFQ